MKDRGAGQRWNIRRGPNSFRRLADQDFKEIVPVLFGIPVTPCPENFNFWSSMTSRPAGSS